ncbi:MAG: MBL fold metallo-hydrolase [Spirochaetes bacterium GWF1_51_8]|nr:MAG: MBL fold metallo-hydrolase [Spirochaetes bacterium GWF1_51_8]
MRTQRRIKGTLSLKNSGDLTVYFIGVGSAFTRENAQTSMLVIKGDDHVLIDCGSTCPNALYQIGVNLCQIERILVTHSHADHIGGLEQLALTWRYVVKKKPSLVITPEYQKILWDFSLKGGCGFGERHDGKYLEFEDFFDVIEPKLLKGYSRDFYEAKIGSINLKIMRTMHFPDSSTSWKDSFWSTGIVIDDRVFYPSDTRFDPELISEIEERFKPEAMFHDTQFFTGGVHASLDDLSTLPAAVKKKMHLVHYADTWRSFEKKIAEYGFAGFAMPNTYYIFSGKDKK